MGRPHKESRRKAEREAAKRERVLEREHRRSADARGPSADVPQVPSLPVEPRKPRPTLHSRLP